MRSEVNKESGGTWTHHNPPRPSYTYTDAEMASVVAERDRLRQFVADIRAADAMVVVTRGAAEVRRIVREYDAENAR